MEECGKSGLESRADGGESTRLSFEGSGEGLVGLTEFVCKLCDGTLGGLKMALDIFVLHGIVMGGGGWCCGGCGGVIVRCGGWRDGWKEGGWDGWLIWGE